MEKFAMFLLFISMDFTTNLLFYRQEKRVVNSLFDLQPFDY